MRESRAVFDYAMCTDCLHSGRTTPIPADAPPSVQAASSARRQIRAQQKRRLFPTIDYVGRVSHFDPDSDYHDFRGFFVLFWIGLAIMVITSMLRQVKETGYPFQIRQWNLFREKVWELGLVDGAMVGSTAAALPLQKLFLNGKGPLRWSQLGIAIQSVYQVLWLAFWCTYVCARESKSQVAHPIQISLHSRLELDRSGLLHSALACNFHEDALLRVSLSEDLKRVMLMHSTVSTMAISVRRSAVSMTWTPLRRPVKPQQFDTPSHAPTCTKSHSHQARVTPMPRIRSLSVNSVKISPSSSHRLWAACHTPRT